MRLDTCRTSSGCSLTQAMWKEKKWPGNEARLGWNGSTKRASRDLTEFAILPLPPQVCERMFNALLAWATTRDVRYLLAAQRSLTAVQNQEGDT